MGCELYEACELIRGMWVNTRDVILNKNEFTFHYSTNLIEHITLHVLRIHAVQEVWTTARALRLVVLLMI